jgi:hypothetical protein
MFSMCPLKGVLGDFKETEQPKKPQAAETKREEK